LPSDEQWLENVDSRRDVLLNIKPNNTLYKCKSDDNVISILERALGASLYFRYVKSGDDSLGQIDFCLVYGDGSSRVYTEWSDGQRAVFYFLTLIRQVAPDILLLDEIENHLHPAYISDVLSFLKGHVSQSIITTHHPHVVFSELVDKVVYLEVQRPPAPINSASEVDYVKKHFQGSPIRSFNTLDNSFEKLAAIYKMFSRRDMQLLLQAQGVLYASEMIFYSAFNKLFEDEVVVASGRITPDSQSKQLLNALKKLGLLQGSRDKYVVLDFGAGYGRTENEFSKMSLWQKGGDIEWVCWERDSTIRDILQKKIADSRLNAIIPNNISDIKDSSVDICTLVNVIHHLTPNVFADIIQSAISKISLTGALVILELHPLISAEKFAVPYPPERLISIFRKLGFIVSYEIIPIRDTSAYCLVVTGSVSKGMILSSTTEEIKNIIEEQWALILEDAIHGYAQRQKVNDYGGLRELLRSLTTIASICAWQQKIWL
jgi:energy-coupling factor transporter ATP-binding protein EcfA2